MKKLFRVIIALLILWVPFQNFILPLLYTTLSFPPALLKNAILVKEIGMSGMFSVLLLFMPFQVLKSRAIFIFCGFFVLLLLNIFIPLFIYHSTDTINNEYLKNIRLLLTPGILFICAFLVKADRKYLHRIITMILAVSFIASGFGIIETLFLDTSFWTNNVNIAKYNIEVKGEQEAGVNLKTGLSGSAAAREVFTFVKKRLNSTYGDPISFAIANALPALFLFIYMYKRKANILSLFCFCTILLAEFLSLTRSAWILLFGGIALFILKKGRIKFIAIGIGFVASAFIFIQPLYTFILSTLSFKADPEHALGVINYFTMILFNPKYIIGKGVDVSQIILGESGWAFVHIQLGLAGVLLFCLIIIYLVKMLSKFSRSIINVDNELWALSESIRLILVLSPIIMIFYQYPFYFLPYFNVWVLAGFLIGYYKTTFTERADFNEGSIVPGYPGTLSNTAV